MHLYTNVYIVLSEGVTTVRYTKCYTWTLPLPIYVCLLFIVEIPRACSGIHSLLIRLELVDSLSDSLFRDFPAVGLFEMDSQTWNTCETRREGERAEETERGREREGDRERSVCVCVRV